MMMIIIMLCRMKPDLKIKTKTSNSDLQQLVPTVYDNTQSNIIC